MSSKPHRPRRSVAYPKSPEDAVTGISWSEETQLNKALYASLNERRSGLARPSDDDAASSVQTTDTARVESMAAGRKRSASTDTDNTSSSEPSGSRINSVRAQRKFAQGYSLDSPVSTPRKDYASTLKLIKPQPLSIMPCKRAKTEDFLTFLCLRGTPALPPSLEFFNYAQEPPRELSSIKSAHRLATRKLLYGKLTGLHQQRRDSNTSVASSGEKREELNGIKRSSDTSSKHEKKISQKPIGNDSEDTSSSNGQIGKTPSRPLRQSLHQQGFVGRLSRNVTSRRRGGPKTRAFLLGKNARETIRKRCRLDGLSQAQARVSGAPLAHNRPLRRRHLPDPVMDNSSSLLGTGSVRKTAEFRSVRTSTIVQRNMSVADVARAQLVELNAAGTPTSQRAASPVCTTSVHSSLHGRHRALQRSRSAVDFPSGRSRSRTSVSGRNRLLRSSSRELSVGRRYEHRRPRTESSTPPRFTGLLSSARRSDGHPSRSPRSERGARETRSTSPGSTSMLYDNRELRSGLVVAMDRARETDGAVSGPKFRESSKEREERHQRERTISARDARAQQRRVFLKEFEKKKGAKSGPSGFWKRTASPEITLSKDDRNRSSAPEESKRKSVGETVKIKTEDQQQTVEDLKKQLADLRKQMSPEPRATRSSEELIDNKAPQKVEKSRNVEELRKRISYLKRQLSPSPLESCKSEDRIPNIKKKNESKISEAPIDQKHISPEVTCLISAAPRLQTCSVPYNKRRASPVKERRISPKPELRRKPSPSKDSQRMTRSSPVKEIRSIPDALKSPTLCASGLTQPAAPLLPSILPSICTEISTQTSDWSSDDQSDAFYAPVSPNHPDSSPDKPADVPLSEPAVLRKVLAPTGTIEQFTPKIVKVISPAIGYQSSLPTKKEGVITNNAASAPFQLPTSQSQIPKTIAMAIPAQAKPLVQMAAVHSNPSHAQPSKSTAKTKTVSPKVAPTILRNSPKPSPTKISPRPLAPKTPLVAIASSSPISNSSPVITDSGTNAPSDGPKPKKRSKRQKPKTIRQLLLESSGIREQPDPNIPILGMPIRGHSPMAISMVPSLPAIIPPIAQLPAGSLPYTSMMMPIAGPSLASAHPMEFTPIEAPPPKVMETVGTQVEIDDYLENEIVDVVGDIDDLEDRKSPVRELRSPKPCSPKVASPRKKLKVDSEDAPCSSPQFCFPGDADQARVVDVPVFHPTEQQFQDPLAYIAQIRHLAEQYGMCKIIPPSSWKPECKVNDDLRFTNQMQYVHMMYQRWGPNRKAMECIRRQLRSQGVTLEQPPLIGSLEVDLPRLCATMRELGGLQSVLNKKKWNRVADVMGISKLALDRTSKLYSAYCKYLLSWDTLSAEDRQKVARQVEEDRRKRDLDAHTEAVTKGRSTSLSAFFRAARNTMTMWFKDEPNSDQVENEYWKILTDRNHHVAVQSARIDTKVSGSGFAMRKDNHYSRHPLNLNNLGSSSGSVLRHLGPVSHVTIPELHLNMLFSTEGWHRELHALPQIYYIHTGADIIWYSVPSSQEDQLRVAMKNMFPGRVRDSPMWLLEDDIMVHPDELCKRGVSVGKTVQKQHEFLLVFQQTYHARVSCGYNIGESVYYAFSDYLQAGYNSMKAMNETGIEELFPVEKILCNLANCDKTLPSTLVNLLPVLETMVQEELSLRAELQSLGVKRSVRMNIYDEPISWNKRRLMEMPDEEDYICEQSRKICYLSMFVNDGEQCVLSLQEALTYVQKRRNLKTCKIVYRYTPDELKEMVKNVKDRISNQTESSGKRRTSK